MFIYKGESENQFEKEICSVYTVFQDDFKPFQEKVEQMRDITTTCYKYGSWTITRGPFVISKLVPYASLYKFYQRTNSDKVLIYADGLTYVLNS